MDARDKLKAILQRAESPGEGEETDARFSRIAELARQALADLGPTVDWPTLRKVLVIAGGLALIVVVGLIFGWTQWTYECIWANTTGRPWTHVMRDNPLLLPIPALAVMAWLARFLPLKYWARVVLVFSVFGIAYISGHVFWGEKNPEEEVTTTCPVSLVATKVS